MKRRFQLNFVLLLSVGAAGGCSSSQMSRIDQNRDIYETWPIEVKQAVLDGKVEQGMTPDMVRVAWGQPSEVVAQSASSDEIWVYKKGGDDGTMMMPGGAYPSGGMGGQGIGISTGRGGTSIGTTGGIGIGMGGGGIGIGGSGIGMGGSGIGMGGTGMGTPIYTRPTPGEVKEVVFRSGVVYRADAP